MWEYILLHRINYDKLFAMKWEGIPRRGTDCLRDMACTLRDAGVLKGLGNFVHLPEMDLIVLDHDDVTKDERWQYLTRSKTSTTGQDPRRRTVVFSSIALLGNAVWCNDMGLDISGSVDGTHGMSNSPYKLLTLGVHGFSQSRACRTFHPLAFHLDW
jgi:hypothetical protein